MEFDDGLSFLEPHKTIRKANKISSDAVPVRVSVPRKFRTHFKIEYDNGQTAEVSWSFIRELPPKRGKKNGEPPFASDHATRLLYNERLSEADPETTGSELRVLIYSLRATMPGVLASVPIEKRRESEGLA